MRQSFAPSLANDGSSIAYIVRDGGYPYAVHCLVDEHGIGEERPIDLPVTGPVTRVLHSPDSSSIACEVSPKGSERTMTFIVTVTDDEVAFRRLDSERDVKTTLVEWDGRRLAMDAVTGDGVTEARSVHPDTASYRVLDRRSDSILVAAEGGHALMRVGPRGDRDLLLVAPEGRWLPLLTPDPGSITERGVILPAEASEDEIAVLVVTDHGQQRSRIVRIGVNDEVTTVTELIDRADADVDEFVVSEDVSTVAVLWNHGGVSDLEVFSLADDQSVISRRSVELPGMVASDLSITEDGSLLALTVEGPDLPRTVEVLGTGIGQVEPLDPERSARLHERHRLAEAPEFVRYAASDGLELSGWLYPAADRSSGEPGSVYVHLHGGPENQSRPVHHDVLRAISDSGVTVFTPNIRGSLGSGRAFHHADDRYGRFAAARDVAETADFLVQAGLADEAGLALGGRSYGGYLTLLVGSLYPGKFAGLVDACGMTSFKSYFAGTEPWLASAAYPEYGYPMHDKELLERISPLAQADGVDSPVLLIHGLEDTNVPPSESLQYADALRSRGVEPEMLLIDGEGHQFVRPRSRRLIAETMVRFFQSLGLTSGLDLGRFDDVDR